MYLSFSDIFLIRSLIQSADHITDLVSITLFNVVNMGVHNIYFNAQHVCACVFYVYITDFLS